ncbi:MAG: hypothetical protein GY765_26785 [bacterium]|nr:hypothetical protein [bacterium]
MKKSPYLTTADRPDWPEIAVTAVIAFGIGLLVYGPLAGITMNNSLSRDISIAFAGDTWRTAIKYGFAVTFSIFSGVAYHFVSTRKDYAFAACVAVSLLLGVGGLVLLLATLLLFFIMLMIIFGIWALFYGPGDR